MSFVTISVLGFHECLVGVFLWCLFIVRVWESSKPGWFTRDSTVTTMAELLL